ncbi:response regulator [Candidatus Saccharibacteria bacterium]|nr:response regulator [Candidatus Saccharibacteria bacterium]
MTEASTPHTTIVIVEDDQYISRMYNVKLANAGYHVVLGQNGLDAIKLMNEHHPRLILIDINMPEMTGLDAIRQLKNDGYDFSHTGIIFLTNSDSQDDIERAKTMGADYIIKANITPKDMLEVIKKNLASISS